MELALKDLIGPVVAALAVAVGIWQYRTNAGRDFIKPVREAQLKLYLEASAAAAQIATLGRGSDEWRKARNDFLRLFYGPMAIVEEFDHQEAQSRETQLTVEQAMIMFKSCLDDETQCAWLRGLSLALAHACRESLGRSWGYQAAQLRGDYQEIAGFYAEWQEANAPPAK